MADGKRGRPRIREGMALTAKQQAAYDLKLAGKSRAEMALILGISVPVVSKTLQAVYKKLGIKHEQGYSKESAEARRVENTSPEKAAAFIDAVTEPEDKWGKITRAYEEAGLPPSTARALLRRLQVKYANGTTPLRDLKTGELLQMVNKRLDLTLTFMDDATAAAASHRDLGLVAAALIEKRALLRGEPTQIISDHERKKLHELLPLAIAEVQRRGLTVPGIVTERTIEPA